MGAHVVRLAEMTHFSLGHDPTGPLSVFLESPGISQVYLWTCQLHLSAAIVSLFPARCCQDVALSYYNWNLESPRYEHCTGVSLPSSSDTSVAEVSKSYDWCPHVLEKQPYQVLSAAHLFSKGHSIILWNPKSKELDTVKAKWLMPVSQHFGRWR